MKAASSCLTSWLVTTLLSANESLGGCSSVRFRLAFQGSPAVLSMRHGSAAFKRDALYTATSRSPGFKKGINDGDNEGVGDGFLEDGDGHINPELAQRIFRWEQDHQINVNVRSQFSTRDGLRWVKELVSKMATSTSSKSDLIQEGVVELMQVMTSYEHEAPLTETFEAFAKKRIRRVLEDYEVKGKLASSTDSHRRALSVESTVEIIDPLETRYSNQDEWEVREGLVLDNGRQLMPDELVEEFLDESVQYEGEDQMWAHQQQTAAPLRDSIPESDDDASSLGFFRTDGDSDISPDDAVLRDMILYNVDEFLGSTLDDLESHIIQLRFGLNLDEPKSHKEIAFDLGITVNKVRKIQKEALEKLRNAYAKEYADDNDNQHNHEDTV